MKWNEGKPDKRRLSFFAMKNRKNMGLLKLTYRLYLDKKSQSQYNQARNYTDSV